MEDRAEIICMFGALAFGYFAGAFPTGFLAARLFAETDIRKTGSGNIGATNVGRLMGKKWAVGVAVFDMLKGGLAVLAASCFIHSHAALAAVGVSAVIGHNFPLWLKFKGGKGVATSFGVIAFFDIFNPLPALLGGAVWYLVMRCTKYVSAASMVGLFAAACFTYIFGLPAEYTAASFLLAVLSVIRHIPNIKRLAAGTEPKVKH